MLYTVLGIHSVKKASPVTTKTHFIYIQLPQQMPLTVNPLTAA